MEITIIRSSRKTLALQLDSALKLVVRAPRRARQEQILAFIEHHRGWIEKQVVQFERFPGLPKSEYRHGGVLWLLGERKDISVVQSKDRMVLHDGKDLIVQLGNTSASSVVKAISRWKRGFAQDYLKQQLVALHRESPVDLPEYSFSLRKMKRQWGNCSRQGHIKLNPDLIRYPEACIRHVIWHELSHLVHFNHSKAFYSLLTRLNPNWKTDRQRLREFSG